jgi:hypothetical protein
VHDAQIEVRGARRYSRQAAVADSEVGPTPTGVWPSGLESRAEKGRNDALDYRWAMGARKERSMGLDLNLRSRTRPRQLTNCSTQTPTARRSTSPRQWFDAGSSLPIAHCSTREWQIMLPDIRVRRAMATDFSYNPMKRTWCRLARVASHPPTLMLGQTTMKLNTLQKRVPRTCQAGLARVPSCGERSWLDNAIVSRDSRHAPFIPARGPHP